MINLDKTIGIYIRKESELENLVAGDGRLQWLKYELEDYKGNINIFLDDYKQCNNIEEIIGNIKKGNIHVVLIWSIDDIDKEYLEELATVCSSYEIPIMSFCESNEWINQQIDIIAGKSKTV